MYTRGGQVAFAYMQRGILVAFGLIACNALSMPVLTGVSPLGVSPGQVVEITLQGNNFTDDLRLWRSFAGKAEFVKRIDAKQAVFRVTVPKGMPTQVGALRVYDRTGISEPLLIMVDTLSTVTATSTDKTKPMPLKFPVAVDGKMGGVNSLWFSFDAKIGQKISLEVYAERIASKADPVIRLMDPDGREVGYADDDDVLGSDAALVFQAKTVGAHLLELRDVQYRSGGLFHLRVGNLPVWPKPQISEEHAMEKEPNDELQTANPLKLGVVMVGSIEEPGARDHFRLNGQKDQWISFRVLSRDIGSPSNICLELIDASGKSIANAGTGLVSQPVLRQRLPADGAYTLLVEEGFRRGGPRFTYQIASRVDNGRFRLRLKDGVDAKKKPIAVDRLWAIPGQRLELNIQAERFGYEEPITLFANKGWPSSANVIKVKSKETRMLLEVPEDAKAGELHELILKGIGEGESVAKTGLSLVDGFRARWPLLASPPSGLLDHLPVVIIEPVKISMPDVKLKPGTKAKVRVSALRPPEPLGAKPDPKPIAIELKNLPAGVAAPDKITVEAKKDFVEIELTCAADAKPIKAQVAIKANSTYRGAQWTKESSPVSFEVLAK